MTDKKKHDAHLPSSHDSLSKSSSDRSSNSRNVTQCPHCHEHMTEVKMLKHLEHCQSWTTTDKSADGSTETISYVGSNHADQMFNLCSNGNNTLQTDMTKHVERCPQRLDTRASEKIKRRVHHPPSIRKNNIIPHRFSALAISCPRCGDLRHLENKMRHAEKCQKLDVNFQAANGISGSFFYAGPNNRLINGLRQAATSEYSDTLDQE